MRRLTLILLLFLLFPAARADKTLRVYHVGNSVTDTINYRALGQLASSRKNVYVFGRHMIPGAPLSWIWEHPNDGFREEPFGLYPRALSDFQWDVLTLEPFDRHLDGPDGDIAMAKNFIERARGKSPKLTVYVYSRWPRREKDGSLDFGAKWLRKYTGGWDGTEETRDYFERVTGELKKAYPEMRDRIQIVPVGDVLLELDRRMKAGRVPGYTDIVQVYKDGIHFNDVGGYIVGCTFYATLYKDNPKGLPSKPYNVDDAKLAGIIQEAVWQIVSARQVPTPARPAPNP